MSYTREHFLADLIQARGMRLVAELGLWKGRTICHLLKTCPAVTVIGVDAWKYRPENAAVPGGETYEQWNMAGLEKTVRASVAPYGDRARILKMETHEAALRIEDRSLDLVFIDADHSYAGCRRDILDWAPKVKPGGIVSGHDIDWPTVLQAVRELYPDHQVGPDNVWWVEV